MSNRIWILSLGLNWAVAAQDGTAINLSNGVNVVIARADSRPNPKITTEFAPATGRSFYRIFRDENRLAIFAYEFAVARSADGRQLLLTVKPAGTEFGERYPSIDGGKPTPTLPAAREFPPLDSGGRAEVLVLEDTPSGDKITDVITVRLQTASGVNPAGQSTRPAGALRFVNMQVYANRQLVSPANATYSVAGKYAMFYLPGKGGYFFAAAEPEVEGFVKAGWVDGARMQFTLDNEVFDCTADATISTEQRTELWVRHDAQYRPEGNWTQPAETNRVGYFAAAADTLHWWLR